MDPSTDRNRLGALQSAITRNLGAAQVCAEIARLFAVRETEVALLQVKRSFLEFVFPPELKAGGAIPSRVPLSPPKLPRQKGRNLQQLYHGQHASIFEVVKLGAQAELSDSGDSRHSCRRPSFPPINRLA